MILQAAAEIKSGGDLTSPEPPGRQPGQPTTNPRVPHPSTESLEPVHLPEAGLSHVSLNSTWSQFHYIA